MGNAWAFAARLLWREWRAGELRLLALALVVAVAGVSAVGFFTDRIGRALVQQSGELLAADLALDTRNSLRPEWLDEAARLGLRQSRTTSFRSVVLAGERMQLAEVKAVADGYPLRGSLRIADRPFASERQPVAVPAPGEAWLDARLLQELDLSVGERLTLGALTLEVSAVLTYEPDRGGEMFNIAPRLMINQADVAASGLLGVGALKRERLLLAGDEAALEAFGAAVKPTLEGRDELLGGRDARPELKAALQRADRFLGLAALVSLLLAGVAIALAAHRHAARHLDASALMRCMGAGQGFIARAYLGQLLLLGLAASLFGALLGLGAQELLARLMAGFLVAELPAPSLWPLLHALLVGLVTLFGFAAPPLLALKEVPPLRVLRRELGAGGASGRLVYGSALLALLALMGWQAQDLKLTLLLAAGALATLALFGLVGWGLVRLLGKLRGGGGVAWRFGVANLARRSRTSVLQVVAFGLGITVLLLLGVVRGDLLDEWADSLPPDAPNHFLINVQPEQVAPLQAFFRERGEAAPGLHPMIRGRLLNINAHAVSADDYESPRARRLSQREFNLSQGAELAADNRIVAGEWWPNGESGVQWSVEQGLAETLGIALGDTLTFHIGGSPLAGPVTSLRTVEWDSFQVNFFVLAPPGQLTDAQASYITSFHLPVERKALLGELVRAFPNVTVIDVDALMTRVRGIIERVSLAVEFVFLFTLLAGLMVLLAAIQATHDERLHEGAILRTLGAGRRAVQAGLLAEFAAIGLLAGVLAAAAASLLGLLIAQQLFQISAVPNPLLWLYAIGGGGTVVTAAGLWGTRRVLSSPPLRVLRGD